MKVKKLYARRFPGGSPPEKLAKQPKDMTKFRVAKRMELESILLLKNEPYGQGKSLPLSAMEPIAVFGNGSVVTNVGGGGSGGSGGSFRIGFLTAMDDMGLPYVTEVSSYYRAKAQEGQGVFDDVHGWDDSDETLWGAQEYSMTGWNNAAPIAVPELKLDDELVVLAGEKTNTAVLFLSRTVGTEEMDRGIPKPSDWYLNPSEEALITQVTGQFENVVLVINSSGAIDFSWMERLDPKGKIRSIVFSYGAGSYYGEALVELLYGKENFSAKLCDTLTYTIEAHHTTRNFGGQQSYEKNGTANGFGDGGRRYGTLNGPADPVSIYQEYVYTGYRYFDTFRGSSDDVLFPFGFGLSYSKFNFSDYDVKRNGELFVVSATITNTSAVAGKAVLQVYASSPNDKELDQPYQRLMSFSKTKLLKAGESQRISASFSAYDLSSYSESRAAYILEEGLHLIRVGDSSRNTVVAGAINIKDGPIIVHQLSNRLTLDSKNPDGGNENQAEFDRLRLNSQIECDMFGDREKDARELAVGVIVDLYQEDVVIQTYTDEEIKAKLTYTPGKAPLEYVSTLQSVASGEVSLSDYVAQMTTAELAYFLSGGAGVGNVYTCPDDPSVPLTVEKSKPSTPNAYMTGAGASRSNSRIGLPSLSYSDGSCGIPINIGLAENLCTDPNPGYPRAPGIACIWDPEVFSLWGKTVAEELVAANVDVWLAPSINLHRNPLNGRNAEYFSEDPVLSGVAAREVSKSVGEAGLTVCCKHFVCNDQEQFRRGRHTRRSEAEGNSLDAINSITSERALREISLKPFEMAIRTGKVHSVMSAFNKVNGWYCASCPELLTDILRGEWGFEGFVVTDWGDYDEIAHAAEEMLAGNDMIMSGIHTRYSIIEQVWDGINQGDLGRDILLRNAENVIRTILHSRNIFRDGKYNTNMIGESNVPYHVKNDLTIRTGVLPPAIIGVPYEELKVTPLFAGGDEGTTSYTFSIAPDSETSAEQLARLGLTLHGNGSITGQAVSGSTGIHSITFRVTSDFGYADKTLELNITDIAILPEQLEELRLGVPYEHKITAVCGDPTVQLTLEGELPDELSFDTETGMISGLPEESGLWRSYEFAVVAKGERVHKKQNYSLRVENYIDVSFDPTGSATVEAGSPVKIPFEASRGIHAAVYNFSISEGHLPDGMYIGGMKWTGYSLNGTPAKPGTYEFKLRAEIEDTVPLIFVDVPYTITVLDSSSKPLTIDDNMLPAAKVTNLYSAQIKVSGGQGKKTFRLDRSKSSSKLPAGLVVSDSGAVSCAPQATDSDLYMLYVTVSDQANNVAEAMIPLYVGGLLEVNPATSTELHAEAGKSFEFKLSASGGFTNQFKYTLLSDAPNGVELVTNPDYTGVLCGTVAEKGSYRLVIEVDEAFTGSPVTTVVYYTLVIS